MLKNWILKKGYKTEEHCGRPITQLWKMPFTERRSLGEHISGPVLYEKALECNTSLNVPTDFKATAGWLHNFKTRHKIQELEVHGEK